MKNAQQLRNRLAELAAEGRAIENAAQGRDLTAEELARIALIHNEFTQTEAKIQIADAEERAGTPVPARTSPAPTAPNAAARRIASPTNGTCGFKSPGEFFACVRAASAGQVDGRLLNAVTTYGGEGGPGGADGGFAVPPAWRTQILELVAGPGTLIDLLNPITAPTNQVILPVDENSAHSSSGITAAWTAEAAAITASKPELKQVTINLHKVAGLVHLSDELVEDNPATGAYALTILAKKIRAVVEEALVAGDGLAKPLGLINAPALVTQAKSASTLQAVDLAAMASRMVPGSYNNAFWLVHTSALPKIWTLTLGQQPIMAPDFSKSPYGTLLGRPLFTSEFCSDYNTVGDIILASPDGYGLAVKSGGPRTETSIHFAFDQHLQSFRATMRVGGTPLLSAAVARKNGSSTLSHIVAMGVRS